MAGNQFGLEILVLFQNISLIWSTNGCTSWQLLSPLYYTILHSSTNKFCNNIKTEMTWMLLYTDFTQLVYMAISRSVGIQRTFEYNNPISILFYVRMRLLWFIIILFHRWLGDGSPIERRKPRMRQELGLLGRYNCGYHCHHGRVCGAGHTPKVSYQPFGIWTIFPTIKELCFYPQSRLTLTSTYWKMQWLSQRYLPVVLDYYHSRSSIAFCVFCVICYLFHSIKELKKCKCNSLDLILLDGAHYLKLTFIYLVPFKSLHLFYTHNHLLNIKRKINIFMELLGKFHRRDFPTRFSFITREPNALQTCKLSQKIPFAILRRMQ